MYEAVDYEGEPAESEEMQPQWFLESNLPLKVRLFVQPCICDGTIPGSTYSRMLYSRFLLGLSKTKWWLPLRKPQEDAFVDTQPAASCYEGGCIQYMGFTNFSPATFCSKYASKCYLGADQFDHLPALKNKN